MFKPVDAHPNFPKLEEEILRFWEKQKVFEKSLEQTRPSTHSTSSGSPRVSRGATDARGKKPFVFFEGPQFATGLPHYGHILASTIKDVIPRYQTMKGRFVRRRWGWDCHGLPIEEIVERKLKISGKKDIEALGIKKFNETCREQVLQYVEEWGKTVRRIARWVDFDNSYKTMDRDYMESVWWAFKEIYKKGLIYEGRKVLLYCPRCETPISNFEVAMDNSYQDVTEEAVTVKFKVKKFPLPQSLPPGEGKHKKENSSPLRGGGKVGGDTYFLAWTTTPWTLPGNIALAVGKDIKYSAVRVSGTKELLILASTLVERIFSGQSVEVVHGNILGKDLVGLRYDPLFSVPAVQSDKSFTVYEADFVTTEEGTGIVHTAVVYGEEDYELGLREGLPVVPLLDEKGVFNEKAPKLVQGKYFKDSEKLIKDDLEKRGLLLEKKNHKHSYPHCWRCDSPLYYNAIPAWFVNIQKIKNKLLKSNQKEINWFPEHLKLGRYANSVEQAPDWNISRNRYWGNPMPVWRCRDCAKDTVIGSIAELREKAVNFEVIARSNAPKQSQNHEIATRPKGARNDAEAMVDLHRPYIDEVVVKCEHCGGRAKRITEIFDSWVEAASMPFAEFHYPFENKAVFESRLPAQFVAEYIAQTRAWFYVMHVWSFILFGKAPFENVVTTGTILAEDGSKMSKSKNNYPDPWGVIEKYGVDSLRFYLMNSVVMQADNLNFSERDLATVNRKVTLLLWNVYNYFVTYANQSPKVSASPPRFAWRGRGGGSALGGKNQNSKLTILDEWIRARLQGVINEVTEYLDGYDTVRATWELEKFVNDLSTWYVRRSRGRDDAAFLDTLRTCLTEFSKVLAPIMPYISETIFRNLVSDKGSVHLQSWPKIKKLSLAQNKLLKEMLQLRSLVEQVHALRAQAKLKLRQPIASITVPVKSFSQDLLDILLEEVNAREIRYGKALELDTKLTSELLTAGLARELERQINQFRKEAGLKIGEQVDLAYETQSANIEEALRSVDRKKTYLKEMLNTKGQMSHAGHTKELVIEGEKVKLGLKISPP